MANHQANHLPKPWEDELARLRWLERGIEGLAAALRREAGELAGPGSERNSQARAKAEAKTEAATAIGLLLANAGPSEAGDLEWSAWLATQLSIHLEVARRETLRAMGSAPLAAGG